MAKYVYKLRIPGKTLARFFYSHEEYKVDGVPRKKRRYINNIPVVHDTDGRILRRWEEGALVTRKGAERMLAKFNLSLDGYELWCEARRYNPTIRGDI